MATFKSLQDLAALKKEMKQGKEGEAKKYKYNNIISKLQELYETREKLKSLGIEFYYNLMSR